MADCGKRPFPTERQARAALAAMAARCARQGRRVPRGVHRCYDGCWLAWHITSRRRS